MHSIGLLSPHQVYGSRLCRRSELSDLDSVENISIGRHTVRNNMQVSKFSIQTFLVVLAVSICAISITSFADLTTNQKLREAINNIEMCIVEASVSFTYEKSNPPTNRDELQVSCDRKTEAIKCVKERVKSSNLPGIAKRGLLSWVQGRQRYQKKYCTNLDSDQTKAYLKDMSCLMKHKSSRFHQLETLLNEKAAAIEKRNYNDSAPELKQICCALYEHKRNMLDSIGPECNESKEKITELVLETVTEDLSIICEDEDKLMSKVCPSIEKLDLSVKFEAGKSPNAAGLFIYLVTSLGEPA